MNDQKRFPEHRNFLFAGAAIFVATLAGDSFAHVCQKPLAALPAEEYVCEGEPYPLPALAADGTISYTQEFSKHGWLGGTSPQLGDSHELGGDEAVLFVFHLAQASRVSITFAADPADAPQTLKPALSLYRGVFPDEAFDDAPSDPLNPVDEVTFVPTSSPTDAHPDDPNIPAFLHDPETGAVTPNPAYTAEVAAWYATHYTAHNGYRDTLNFTQTGGLDAEGNPIVPYRGQFDALGDWSMANAEEEPPADGTILHENEWSTLFYITHAISPGADANSVYRPAAIKDLILPPGDYSIAADGANCNDESSACVGAFVTGTLSFKATPIRYRIVGQPGSQPQ